MRIAIIGAGNVGSSLGTGWARKGHQVVFGVRDLSAPELSGLLSRVAGSTALAPDKATASAEVVALAVPWNAAEQVVKSLGDLQHKVLLDCTNPVMAWPKLDHAAGKSGGEQVAEWATGGRVVKIFNTTGFENMADPNYLGGKLTMFYASDDSSAKRMAHELAEDLGFEAQDAGPLKQCYLLEVLASLWGSLAYGQKLGRGIGFRLLRR